jgi:hypothetical protein
MTQLHIDHDEWSNILQAVKNLRDEQEEEPYREYLDAIATKIEVALALTPSLADPDYSDPTQLPF